MSSKHNTAAEKKVAEPAHVAAAAVTKPEREAVAHPASLNTVHGAEPTHHAPGVLGAPHAPHAHIQHPKSGAAPHHEAKQPPLAGDAPHAAEHAHHQKQAPHDASHPHPNPHPHPHPAKVDAASHQGQTFLPAAQLGGSEGLAADEKTRLVRACGEPVQRESSQEAHKSTFSQEASSVLTTGGDSKKELLKAELAVKVKQGAAPPGLGAASKPVA